MMDDAMILALSPNAAQHFPLPPIRRGECPTLSQPMPTGDGLLARLRPMNSSMTFPQLAALADATERFGNGLIEITARGSLQARGLKPETVADFEAAVLASGVIPARGLGVETPPLSGLDPDELIEVRPIAAELRGRVAAHERPLALAAKLAVTIDGGGLFHLGAVTADIRLAAFRDSGGQIRFVVSCGGTAARARRLAVVEERQAVDAVLHLLETLHAIGPGARGRDLPDDALSAHYTTRVDLRAIELGSDAPSLLGLFPMEDGGVALGLSFAYVQAQAPAIKALCRQASRLEVDSLRLSPDHGFFALCRSLEIARALQKAAAELGFWTDPADPRRAIAVCAGSTGCASAYFDTRALADRLVAMAPELLDGSFTLHLSGCAKGCAHPAASVLTLVGASTGYGLVVNGAASASPSAYSAENDIGSAFGRLASMVRDSREDGESAAQCLTRLGARRIASAVQLDGT
jgi:precorrin-3B synthase